MPSSEHTPSRLTRRYTEGGDRAVTRFEEGVAGYETRAFRGLGVFSSTPVRTATRHPRMHPPDSARVSHTAVVVVARSTRSLMVRSSHRSAADPRPALSVCTLPTAPSTAWLADQDSVQMLQRSSQIGGTALAKIEPSLFYPLSY